MIIACDVDGVIADLHVEWLRRYNADHGDRLTPADIHTWEIHRFVRPECGKRIYDYLHAPDLYDHVPSIHGAAGGVEYLRRLGHRVVFVTSNVRGMTDQKWEWLARNGFLPAGPQAPDLVCATDKSFFAVDAMIEDYHENLRTSRAATRILLTRPWNAGEQGPWYRANSWPDIVQWLELRAAA